MSKPIAAVIGLLVLSGTLCAQQTLLVLQKHDDSLAWYNPQTGKPEGKAAKVGHIPHEFVVSPDQRYAYVTNYGVDSYNSNDEGGNTVAVVDLKEHKTVREIDFGKYHRPHGITMGKSGRLYVTCDLPPRVLVVDPGKGIILHTADVKEKGPHMVVVSADEKHVWTADALSGTVTDVDLAHGDALKQIEIGGVPMGMVLSPDGRKLFATTHAEKLAVINTATDRLIGSIPISGQPARVTWTPDHKNLLVATIGAGDVVVVDAANERVLQRFHAGRGAEGILADPDAEFGYVSAQRENKVIRFSLKTWKPVGAILTGAMPDSLALLTR